MRVMYLMASQRISWLTQTRSDDRLAALPGSADGMAGGGGAKGCEHPLCCSRSVQRHHDLLKGECGPPTRFMLDELGLGMGDVWSVHGMPPGGLRCHPSTLIVLLNCTVPTSPPLSDGHPILRCRGDELVLIAGHAWGTVLESRAHADPGLVERTTYGLVRSAG